MGSLAFQNGIRDVLYTRYRFALCNQRTYLSKRGWRRSIPHRRWMGRFSGQCRLRLCSNLILRLEPVLIGFEVDGCFEFSTSKYENEIETANTAEHVTLCSSNNELAWSNVQFARESLQTLEWTQEQFGSLCHDPSHNCPAAGRQR